MENINHLTEKHKKAWEAVKATPAYKAWEKADKAMEATPEWKAKKKARKAVEEAEEAFRKTPECLAQNEAYNAYSKAYKKSRDEVEKVFKTMPTKFMEKELS